MSHYIGWVRNRESQLSMAHSIGSGKQQGDTAPNVTFYDGVGQATRRHDLSMTYSMESGKERGDTAFKSTFY